MRLVKVLSGFLLILFFAAFSKKGESIFFTSTPSSARYNETNKHIACKSPSLRSVGSTAISSNAGLENGSTKEMVLITGGTFQMGSEDFADSKPVHNVTVNSFWMDEHEVTNEQFDAFVHATGYITVAERKLNPADFPGVPLDKLIPGSAVFTPPAGLVSLDNPLQWWQYVPGASWRHPLGPSSSIVGMENEPVVHVCYEDAAAYVKWAGKRLPTEAEWEYAARAGKKNLKYYWGNELKPGGKWAANIFQGNFPDKNLLEDGFATTAPVKTYPANSFGLYDMEGNVWEWCSDLYRPNYYQKTGVNNPKGPADSYDPEEPGLEKHVQRGGSFLCSDQYCIRYKAGSRGKGETSSASNNLGFRCVRDK
jgi:formylglycine-generating enzyme